jgi:O-antigen/teichoic acid export membrane protein
MFGMSCVALRAQGTPLVINLHFGPAVNAAYTVASSLSNQANALSTALTRAFQPAVVTAEGEGDREQMLSMAMRVCKFGALLVMTFAIPAILEMDNLLQLWLVDPPEHAAAICQWLLAILIVDRLTGGHSLAVNARGKIAFYEIVQGAILFSAVPLMALCFVGGFGPAAVGYALFVTAVVYCGGRVVFAKKLVGFPFSKWVREIVLPVLFLILTGVFFGITGKSIMPPSFTRLLLTCCMVVLPTIVLSWAFFLSGRERAYLKSFVCRVIRV